MFKTFQHIVILTCLLITGSVHSQVWGQTIHVILAVDSADKNIGDGVIIDLANMKHLLHSNIPEENLNLVVLTRNQMTPDGMLKSIDNLSDVKSDDTIVFYYSGHGANDPSNRKQYFTLTKGDISKEDSRERRHLYRETLLAKIESKEPRLAVLLTDCCNNESKPDSTPRGGDKMVYYPWYSGTPSGFSPLFENLFVACKGTVDITSSKPGEYSFVNGKQPTRGSFFTWAFTDLFKDDKANEAMYWQEFVEKLGPKVEETFKETFPDIAKDIADKNLGTNVRGGRPTGQTVHVNNYPGMSKSNATSTAGSASTSTSGSSTSGSTSAPAGTGPRFGLRAVNHDGDGVRITAITAGAPASKMPRIAIGDIITEINGETIKNESDYDRAVDNSGRTMKVKIRKADSTTTWDLSVDLAW